MNPLQLQSSSISGLVSKQTLLHNETNRLRQHSFTRLPDNTIRDTPRRTWPFFGRKNKDLHQQSLEQPSVDLDELRGTIISDMEQAMALSRKLVEEVKLYFNAYNLASQLAYDTGTVSLLDNPDTHKTLISVLEDSEALDYLISRLEGRLQHFVREAQRLQSLGDRCDKRLKRRENLSKGERYATIGAVVFGIGACIPGPQAPVFAALSALSIAVAALCKLVKDSGVREDAAADSLREAVHVRAHEVQSVQYTLANFTRHLRDFDRGVADAIGLYLVSPGTYPTPSLVRSDGASESLNVSNIVADPNPSSHYDPSLSSHVAKPNQPPASDFIPSLSGSAQINTTPGISRPRLPPSTRSIDSCSRDSTSSVYHSFPSSPTDALAPPSGLSSNHPHEPSKDIALISKSSMGTKPLHPLTSTNEAHSTNKSISIVYYSLPNAPSNDPTSGTPFHWDTLRLGPSKEHAYKPKPHPYSSGIKRPPMPRAFTPMVHTACR